MCTVFYNLCPNKGGGHYLCDGFTAKISPLRRPGAHSYLGLELRWLLEVVFKLFIIFFFIQYVFYGCKYSKTYSSSLSALTQDTNSVFSCGASVAPVVRYSAIIIHKKKLVPLTFLISTERN